MKHKTKLQITRENLRWPDRLKGDQVVFLNVAKKDHLSAIALNFERFTQNGCYGNQPHS